MSSTVKYTVGETTLGDFASHNDVHLMASKSFRYRLSLWRDGDAATTGPRSSKSRELIIRRSSTHTGVTNGAPSRPNGDTSPGGCTSSQSCSRREEIYGKQDRRVCTCSIELNVMPSSVSALTLGIDVTRAEIGPIKATNNERAEREGSRDSSKSFE